MNITRQTSSFASTVLFCVGAALLTCAALPAQAAKPECDGLSSIHRRIVAKADQGPDALRNFVSMTKFIYGIDMTDVSQSLEAWRAVARCSEPVATASKKQQ